jgi:hypothetical protein
VESFLFCSFRIAFPKKPCYNSRKKKYNNYEITGAKPKTASSAGDNAVNPGTRDAVNSSSGAGSGSSGSTGPAFGTSGSGSGGAGSSGGSSGSGSGGGNGSNGSGGDGPDKPGSGSITKRDKLLNSVQNDKLKNAVSEIYRSGATIGDGGIADVVRHGKNKKS